MMLSLLSKKKNPSSFSPNFIPKTNFISHLLHFSFFSTSQDQNPTPKSNFIRDYLISSFGFSPQKAAAASKHIAKFTSAEKPDLVRHFLKHNGFTDAYIQKIISTRSRILCADVHKTLEPNIHALRQLGFTEDELHKLVARNPTTLNLRCAIPRIEFWKAFFKNDMQKSFLAFTRNRCLINLDIDKNVVPSISLLKEYGLSETQIEVIIIRGCGVFGRSITSMEALLKRVQELGFPLGSPMFVLALSALSGVSADLFKAKMELFKSLGWTEGEFITALKKTPVIINLSKETILKKAEFLVDRAGCTQSYIAFRPMLLTFCLEKRLMPRVQVLEILKANGLVRKLPSVFSIMRYPEKAFIEKFVVPYKEIIAPNLHETYATAFRGLP